MAEAKTSAVPPRPGTDAAVARGCTCPVLDNSRGAGWMGTGHHIFTVGCPLHMPLPEALREMEG